MSTFISLCKDTRAQAGIAGAGPTSTTGQSGIYADVVRWVEEAYNEIQTLNDNWNFLHTEVSDDKELTCPGEFVDKAVIISMVRRFVIK